VLDTRPDVASANLPAGRLLRQLPAHDEPEFVGTWSNYPYFPSGTIAFSGIDEGLFLVKVQDAVLAEHATPTDPGPGTEEPAPAQPGAKGRQNAEENKGKDKGKGRRD
jgi:hypothetical protein